MKITFISGRNPDLYIKNAKGEVVETIDLAPVSIDYTISQMFYLTHALQLKTDDIHNLLISKGFERKFKGTNSKVIAQNLRA